MGRRTALTRTRGRFRGSDRGRQGGRKIIESDDITALADPDLEPETADRHGNWGLTPYDRFAAKSRPRRGSRGIDAINEAPFLLADLPDYFLGLPPNKLAACWVACFVDAAWMQDFEPGDVARALVVVADRLHGVKVEIQGEPVIMPAPLTVHNAAGPKAAPMPAAPTVIGKYTILKGPPPEPKRKNARVNEACNAALLLQPGDWFLYEDAPKTFNCKVQGEKWSKVAGFPLILYRAGSGKVVVKRPAEGEAGLKLAQK